MANYRVHPNARVETDQIGEGTNVWAFAHIMKDVKIGAHCNIGDHCFVESGVTIGNNVTIKNMNMIWVGVTIEDGAFIGPNAVFTNDLFPRSPRMPEAKKRYEQQDWLKTTTIKYGASVGAGAVILSGTILGEFCMVAAGAVVTKDVPPHALVLGNPAHVYGWVCQCGKKLSFENNLAVCELCGVRYNKDGNRVHAAG